MVKQVIQQGAVKAMVEMTSIGNISLSLDYTSFNTHEPEEVAEFVEEQTNLTLTWLLQRYSTVTINASLLCDMQREDGNLDETVRINAQTNKVYRHESSRRNVIHSMMLHLFNPKQYQEEYGSVELEGDNSGSQFTMVDLVHVVTINFITPLEYIANALQAKYQLTAGHRLNRYISYLPYNKDPWCFMYCLHNELVGEDQDFEEWFEENKLGRFYEANFFFIGVRLLRSSPRF